MVRADKLEIRPLGPEDDVGSFSCGDADLDDFLRNDARRLQDQWLVRVYLAWVGSELAGYVAVLTDCLKVTQRERARMNLDGSAHPIVPAIKIARLGVAEKLKNQGIGKELIRLCVDLALVTSESAGCRLLTLDAYPAVINYYEGLGFVRNKGNKAQHDEGGEAASPDDNISMRLDIRQDPQPDWLQRSDRLP